MGNKKAGWAWKPSNEARITIQFRQKANRKKDRRDPFYRSEEWMRLRYKALKLYGGKCQCCGSAHGPLHVDHIKPRHRYPQLQLQLSNLQVLCARCNYGKGAWDETDWRGELTPEQVSHIEGMAI